MIKSKHIVLAGNIIINDRKEIFLLYRLKHKFYETPGGKVRGSDCKSPNKPTINELQKTAKRELLEEVDGIEKIIFLDYFGKVNFELPDGRSATANKFITGIKGVPVPNENIFDKRKCKLLRAKAHSV
jgi:8-oxo-dGTP pyrophosphatase MutT (NUDIX family)